VKTPIVAVSTIADGSMHNRDDPADPVVIENRRKFLGSHDITLEQTTRLEITYDRDNFCQYAQTKETKKADGMFGDFDIPHDALVTTVAGHALFLPVADCIGATFYDPIHHVLGLAHLGRHSLEQQGAVKFVEYLSENYQSDPQTIKVWLGPSAGKDVYPIWALDNKGMKEAAFEQLDAAGILKENITDNPAETDKDKNFFSYSEFLKGHRDNDGDHAMVAMMRE